MTELVMKDGAADNIWIKDAEVPTFESETSSTGSNGADDHGWYAFCRNRRKDDQLWRVWLPAILLVGGGAIIICLATLLAVERKSSFSFQAGAASGGVPTVPPPGTAPTAEATAEPTPEWAQWLPAAGPTLAPIAPTGPAPIAPIAPPTLAPIVVPTPAPVVPPTPAPVTNPPTASPTPWFCREPDFDVCQYRNRRGIHCGLEFEVFGSAANLIGVALDTCMTNTANGFRARWNPGDGNYLARKGVRPGGRTEVITYSADYQPGEIGVQRPNEGGDSRDTGFSLLGAYGWTQDPLVEYYVVDNWGIVRPPLSIKLNLGEVQADGGVYDLYVSYRVNKPSIEGPKSFPQYWSVRREPRSSGTITMSKHFDAWEPQGYDIGRFFEVSLVAEGFNTVGTAEVNVTFSNF